MAASFNTLLTWALQFRGGPEIGMSHIRGGASKYEVNMDVTQLVQRVGAAEKGGFTRVPAPAVCDGSPG